MSPYHAPPDATPTVQTALEGHRVDELKQLLPLLDDGRPPTRKAELVAALCRQLDRDEVLRELWQRLDETQRAAVAEVVHGPSPTFDASSFHAKYGREPEWGTLSSWPSRGDARPSLLQAFFCGHRTMPDDLRGRLRVFVPAPAPAGLASIEELPEEIEQHHTYYDYAARARQTDVELVPLTVRQTERAAPHDLEAVLRLAESGKLSVSDKTRRPSGATTRIVAQALREGELYSEDSGVGPIASFAWPLLIQAAGLAELRGSRLALTNAGSKSLAAPAADVLRKIWDRWLSTRLLDELARVDVIKGQTGKGKRGLTAVPGRRQVVADVVAECPVGRWVATDELFRYMRAVGHRFEVTRDPWRLYIGDPQYGSLGYDGCGGWNILQVRYALCVLFEYAATLGIVDVAHVPPAGARPDYHHMSGTDDLDYLSRYDGLAFIRLTPLGANVLGLTESYDPPGLEHRSVFTVLTNLDVVATGDGLTFADRIVLERYGQRTADRVWRLDRDMLLAVAEQGESIADVRAFLAARTATPLPPAVTNLLDDVADRTQRFVDRGAMRVIDCADPALVLRLANDRATRGLCIAAGDHRLLVPAGSEQAFRRAVRTLGYAVPVAEQRRAA
jgi:hypothetical protein